jgi:hypothetical protein
VDLSERMAMGEAAEAFIRGDLGQYILRRCQEEVEAAWKRFETIDPTDVPAIMELQASIRVAKAVPGFMVDLINAYQQVLDNNRYEHGAVE